MPADTLKNFAQVFEGIDAKAFACCRDACQNRRCPAAIVPGATSFTKPAFEFSRDGVIGLMWRADYADKTYDIWSIISRDGGKTFSNSLRVSHAKSPASLPVKGAGNDDHADLCMDKENIHMVWGDFRSGFLGTWYGRVAFSAFEFPAR